MNAADLQKFCADRDDIRYRMQKPFSQGEFTYATNGHVLICVQRLPDVAEDNEAPQCGALISKIPPAVNWIPIPECAALPEVECDECHGTGMATCPTCEHDSDCENCNHTGQVRQRIAVAVGDAHFDQHYLAMLQGYEIAANGPKAAAHIRRGDITGLLMPMRPK